MFEAPLAYEHRVAGNLHSQRVRLAASRRRILTVGLPAAWFLTLLGAVSGWATADGRPSLSALWHNLARFDVGPVGVCLALIAVLLLASYALHPRLARRRMRAAMGPPGRDGPVPVRYRLDRAGLTQTAPDLVSFLPWPQIGGVEEDAHYLFLPTEVGGIPIVLPKAQLGPETAEAVRLWARACAGRPALAPPPAPDAAPDALHLTLRLTNAERVALILHSTDTPSMRRARIVGALAWLVGLSLLYPVLLAVLWAVDPYRVPFADSLPLFLEMAATDFWKPAAASAALIALVLATHRPLRRWLARDLAQELEAEASPDEAVVLIDASGIVTARAGAHGRLAWSLFTGRERVGDLMILPMRWNDVLPLPLRIFEPDALARFERLAEHHLPAPKEPRAR